MEEILALHDFALYSIVSTCLVLVLCYSLNHKRNNTRKPIDIHLLNKRIIEFRPEPLVDPVAAQLLRNKIIEVHQPDENDPSCLNLAKVNYLNMVNNEVLKRKCEECIRLYGVGSCGPRGFYGTIDVHLDLESRISSFLGMEETILYSYGFSTISSAIGAYCKQSDIIFCDECISFCSLQGLVAAKSSVVYFKHNDVVDLETKLKSYEVEEIKRKKLFRKFLLVEGIYAQTGTICPLPELMELRERYKLRIFLDESISFGVLGKTGRGVTEHFNIDRSNVDMIMGSLEGSIGSIGGFCVGATFIIEHQRLSGLGYCFSASLPPFLSYVSICAINMFEEDPTMFQKLELVSLSIDRKLRELRNYKVISNPLSPLKVFEVKNNAVDSIHSFCTQNNIHIKKTNDKLSFNVNIGMDENQVDRIMSVLKEAGRCVEE